MNHDDVAQHLRRALLSGFPREVQAYCAVIRQACIVYVTWATQPDRPNVENSKLTINVTAGGVDWYMSADSSRKAALESRLAEDIREHLATHSPACIEHLIRDTLLEVA